MKKVSFAFLIISTLACGPNKVEQREIVTVADSKSDIDNLRPISPKELQSALITMLRKRPAEELWPPGTKELYSHLASGDYLRRLREAAPKEGEGEMVVLEDWTFNRKSLTFTATFANRIQICTIEGVFLNGAQGNWEARIDKVTVNHLPEEK